MAIITVKDATAIRLQTLSAVVNLKKAKVSNGRDKNKTTNATNETKPSILNSAIVFFIIVVCNKVKAFFVNHYFNNSFFSSCIKRSKRDLISFPLGTLAISKLLI